MGSTFQKVFSSPFDAVVQNEPLVATVEYCYPGGLRGGFVDGLGVEVFPANASPWFATFAAGKLSPNGVTVAFDLPDKNRILAVARGAAYIVDASCPDHWERLEIAPVMGCQPVVCLNLMLLWDFTRFLALGDAGIVWQTPSVSWDGISDVTINNEQAQAIVWNAPTQSHDTVVVDLRTGKFQGGSSPELDVKTAIGF